MKRDFRKRIHDAVNDPNLKTALDRSEKAYMKNREEAFEGVDFEGLRARLRECRESAADRIPELFDRFKREAERIGARVYTAADSEEANRIVYEIAESHGARKIVKSKSMLSEEIELNRHLLSAGLQVTETDLGEWICQLAGERPSHFTAPAIHKTREEIAELFSKSLGREIAADIPTLVDVARREMRQTFIEADLGISGANIAIADTGTLVIVSNEGNARLVTSLPDVHIALVGYEKLVPSLDEAAAILKLLSKSGTGQRMTSYVSFITGPSRTSDIEKTLTLGCHGPKEVHIIFVDNGRLALLNEPEFREALYCVKCGACLNVCPVYHAVGGHVFGHIYVGGIGAILTAFYSGLLTAEEILGLCAACGRCVSSCPVEIDIPRLIVGLRRKLSEEHGRPWVQRLILHNVLADPKRMEKLLNWGRLAQRLFMPRSESVNVPFSALTRFRDLPALAEKPLSEIVPEVNPAKGKKLGTVALYPGCVAEYVYPEIGRAAVNVLTGLGWEVRLPRGQGCCGIPAFMKGDVEDARNLARHNAEIAGFRDADHVITLCPTCAEAFTTEFPKLLGPDSEEAGKLAGKTMDISRFLLEIARVDAGSFEAKEQAETVTYHDSCHAKHGLGISDEPRKLLEMAGYKIAEMEDSDACCGFAGSFCLSYPEISGAILERKVAAIKSSGASVVAAGCPGCLIQLRGGLAKSRAEIRAAHVIELLAANSHG